MFTEAPFSLMDLISIVVATILGCGWMLLYTRKWQKAAVAIDPNIAAAQRRWMPRSYFLGFCAMLALACGLAVELQLIGPQLSSSLVMQAVRVSALNWIFIVYPVGLGPFLWEARPWRICAMNISYHFVLMLILSLVIQFFPQAVGQLSSIH